MSVPNKKPYTSVETLIDFIAHSDVGDLVSQVADIELRKRYASLLEHLVALRDRRPT